MRIGELSQRTGVSTDTLRYYEKVGLLSRAARQDNRYRSYHEKDVHRVSLIKRCRTLGMSLERIERLLGIFDDPNPNANEVHAILDQQLQAIDEQIHELQRLRESLLQLHHLCQGNHALGEACPLVDELEGCHCCKLCEHA